MPIKRTLILLIWMCTTLSLWGQSFDKKISVTYKGQHISKVLIDLSKKYSCSIGFNPQLFNKENKRIRQSFEDKDLLFVLREILDGTGIDYKTNNNKVILFRKPLVDKVLSGQVMDQMSGEKLIGATIFDAASGRGAVTNDYGYFSIKLPQGKHLIQISYLGYQGYSKGLTLENNQNIKVKLSPSLTLTEIVITDKEDQGTIDLSTAPFNLSNKEIANTINNGGEPDVIRTLQSLPGVQSSADGLGGLNVRGGNADQNVILMDDATIFQPSHTFGLFSIFNPETIRKTSYYNDGFGAKYGGRLSSVLDIRTKEGNTEKASGKLSLSTIATNLLIEAPLKKQKSALLIAARRSHLDPFIQNFTSKKKKDNFKTGQDNYYFYDVNIKMHSRLTPKDRIYLSAYKGQDLYSVRTNYLDTEDIDFQQEDTNAQDLNWGNQFISLRWNHEYGPQLFGNVTVTNSQFEYANTIKQYNSLVYFDSTFQDLYQSYFQSTVSDLNVKLDFNYYLSQHHTINFGGAALKRSFVTDVFGYSEYLEYDSFNPQPRLEFISPEKDLLKLEANSFNLYVEDQIVLSNKWRLNVGLHNAYFLSKDAVENFDTILFTYTTDTVLTTNISFQPRVLLAYQPTSQTTLRFGLDNMVQPLHVLTSAGGGLPTDIWVPSTRNVKPQTSWQASAKWIQNHKKWQFQLGFYYKKLDNLIQYGTDAKLPSITDIDPYYWEDNIVIGSGKSYGIETSIAKTEGRLTGKIAYTYSRSTRQFDNFEEDNPFSVIDEGRPFSFIYDQPHNFNAQFNYKINKTLQFYTGWQFHSGTPYTPFVSSTPFNPLDNFSFILSEEDGQIGDTNSQRLKDYHSLAMGLKIDWQSKKVKHHIQLGVTNLYNRQNSYFAYTLYDDFEDPPLKEVENTTLSILPSLRYTVEF